MSTTTPESNVCVSINRTFNVPASKVWRAFTDPEWMCKWNAFLDKLREFLKK